MSDLQAAGREEAAAAIGAPKAMGKIKACVRWIAHWFERKREQRLAKGHGIFRTYWLLILLSPFIIIGLTFAISATAGVLEVTTWFLDELEMIFFS